MADTDLFFSRTGMDRGKVQETVDGALKGADDGELFLEYSQSESFSFDDGRLKAATFDTSQGFGLRAVAGEATGYAHATELSEDAIARDEEALAIRRRILPPGHPYIALSLGSLASQMENFGRNKEALGLHAQAVAIYRALPPGQENELATEINNWGVACYYLGDMACAIDKIGEAIVVWSKVLPPDHTSLLTARTSLAALYSRGGRLQEGEAQLRQAMAALEATARRAPSAAVVIALSSARNELTDNLLAQHRNREALEFAQLRWRDLQANGDPDEAAITALAMLAVTELANGKPGDALAHARTAQARAHARMPGSRREAFALMTLARAQLATGDANAAVIHAREAIAMFTSVLSADHRDTGLAHGVLGRALLTSNQRAEARKELDVAIAILSEKAAWLPELAELGRLRR
jgi:tetratricopeptide (TPR) repeat protein